MLKGYGMPTLAELETIEDNARLCAALGLSFVELNMNLPHCQPEALDADELRRLGDEYGIYFTLHLDENFNPCDFNSAIASAYCDTALRTIALAKDSGIPILNMHMNPGVHFKLPNSRLFLFDHYREYYISALEKFRDACTDAATDSEILICIENCNGFTSHELDGIELLLKSKAFALTLDIGHAHLAKNADAALYEKHADRLSHIHIHDANDITCHLTLGSGDLDLPAALASARKASCRRVIEVKAPDELAASVDWIKRIEGKAHAHA